MYYVISDNDSELDEDNSVKTVTAYAKQNGKLKKKLNDRSTDSFVCSFRPATVFGFSPRLRCDVVFNNLVACATHYKKN